LSELFAPVVADRIAAAANSRLELDLLAVLRHLHLAHWLIKLEFKVPM
jgi:hypothetical protein